MNTLYNLQLRFETEAGDICAIRVPYADTGIDGGDVKDGMETIIETDVYEHKGSPLDTIISAELIGTQIVSYNVA